MAAKMALFLIGLELCAVPLCVQVCVCVCVSYKVSHFLRQHSFCVYFVLGCRL